MQKEHKELTVAEFLTARLRLCSKSKSEIATNMGYLNPGIITMFAEGKTKLPLKDIERLSKSLGIDPVYLTRLVLREYMPEVLSVIENALDGPLLTQNERKLIQSYRRITRGKDATALVCDTKEIVALVMV